MAMFPGGYGIRPYGVGVDARHRPGKFSAAAKSPGIEDAAPYNEKSLPLWGKVAERIEVG